MTNVQGPTLYSKLLKITSENMAMRAYEKNKKLCLLETTYPTSEQNRSIISIKNIGPYSATTCIVYIPSLNPTPFEKARLLSTFKI